MSAFRLVLPIADLHNSNHRGHWSVAARKRAAMREAARLACTDQPRLSGPVALTVTFGFPDRRPRDLDNYEIKGAIDGAVTAGLIDEDRSTVLRSVTREGGPVSPKGYAVLVFTFRPAEEN
jgi:Holliday junction resolvase RusA-like endonuclease